MSTTAEDRSPGQVLCAKFWHATGGPAPLTSAGNRTRQGRQVQVSRIAFLSRSSCCPQRSGSPSIGTKSQRIVTNSNQLSGVPATFGELTAEAGQASPGDPGRRKAFPAAARRRPGLIRRVIQMPR